MVYEDFRENLSTLGRMGMDASVTPQYSRTNDHFKQDRVQNVSLDITWDFTGACLRQAGEVILRFSFLFVYSYV